MKTLAIILCTSLATSAAVLPFTGTGPTYSSDFQCAYPIEGAFNNVPSPASVWHMHIDDTVPGFNSTTQEPGRIPLVIDIDGNGIMDTLEPGIRVTITDFNVTSLTSIIWIEDSRGKVWHLSSARPTVSLSTPIVVEEGSELWISNFGGINGNVEMTIQGRVSNL